MGRVIIIEGDGGVGTTGSNLVVNPSPIPFGIVTNGQSSTITISLTAQGDTAVNVTAIGFGDGAYSVVTALPVAIAARATTQVQIKFSPVDNNPHNTNMTVTCDANNAPVVVPVTGSGIATATLSVSPPAHDYGNQKTTVASAEFLFTVTNTGGADIQITALNYTAPFSAGPTQPGLPLTLHSGQNTTVGVIFTPSVAGFVSTSNALSIVNNSPTTPVNVQCSGTGFLITPAFSIVGITTQTLFGMFLTGIANVFQVNPANLSCEEAGFWKRQMDFGQKLIESHLIRLGLRHDDLGQATLTYQAKSKRNKAAPVTATMNLGTVSADGLVTTIFADPNPTSAEVIELQFSFAANAGPISVVAIVPELEVGGDYVEGT